MNSEEISDQDCLPFRRRLVFCTYIPILISFVACSVMVFVTMLMNSSRSKPPDMAGILDVVGLLFFPLVFAIFILPWMIVSTFFIARLKWKHWSSALADGFGGILIGVGFVFTVFFLLDILS